MGIQYFKYFVISVFMIGMGLQEAKGELSSPQYVEGDVIIKFKEHSDVANRQSINDGPDNITLQGVSGFVNLNLEQSFNNFSIQHYSGVSTQSTREIIKQLQDHPSIEYIEPNYIIQKTDVSSANVLTSSEAKRYADHSQGQSTDPIRIKEAQQALTQGNAPTLAAVLDSGIDVEHEALAHLIWTNDEIPNNGIDDDKNGFIDDINGYNFVKDSGDISDCDGHGTYVAGIIAQTAEDIFPDTKLGTGMGMGLDTAEVAFADNPTTAQTNSPVQIMGLKILNCNGKGSVSSAIKAIDYAIDNGAKVLNNSYGTNVYSYAFHEAVSRSYYAKTVFVAAAGNNQSNNDIKPVYPANYPVPNVISVAATDLNDNFATHFSNYGYQTVHEAAPGVNIFSTYRDNQYAFLTGTSMAAPFVAGVVSLVLYEQPYLSGYQAKKVVLDSSEPIVSLSNLVQGERRLHALNAVLAAQQTSPNYDTAPNYEMPHPPQTCFDGNEITAVEIDTEYGDTYVCN